MLMFFLGVLLSLVIFGGFFHLIPTINISASNIERLTAISTFMAVVVALFGDILKAIFIHSDVKIIDSKVNTQIPEPGSLNPIQGHTRLLIENTGKASAYEVEVYITKITDPDNLVRDDFLPVPLSWTHDGRPKRNFHPHQCGYIDLVRRDDIHKLSSYPTLVLAAGAGVFNYDTLSKGQTVLELTLYEKSGKTKKYDVTISYDIGNPCVEVLNVDRKSG